MKKYIINIFLVLVLSSPMIAEALTVDEMKAQIAQLLEQVIQLQQQLTVMEGTEVEQKTIKFTQSLSKGIENSEVRELQKYLAQDKNIYPEGLVTGYFGSLTEKAVKNFQKKHSIETAGVVGPKTRAKLNELYGVVLIAEKEKSEEKVKNLKEVVTPTDNFLLIENFENSVKGEIGSGEIKYVAGKEGLGFIDVYNDNPDGGKMRARVLKYDNSGGKYIHPDFGKIEFWVKPLESATENEDHHGFFSARAGTYYWNIQLYKDKFVVYRDFPPCVRSQLETSHIFETGKWYKLTLTWRGEETNFYINDEKINGFETVARSFVLGPENFGTSYLPGSLEVGDDIFVTDNLQISRETDIPASAMTTERSENIVCPNIKSLEENVQETYKEIALNNFPDQDTRDKIKHLIDLLAFDWGTNYPLIEHVILIEDERVEILAEGHNGRYSLAMENILLRKSLFDSVEKIDDHARIFFHEAGHAYTMWAQLGYSGPTGPNKRKEWAEISGIDKYVGECVRPDSFLFEDGFLTAYGSTMADEDLAEWVGTTYDLYYSGETFSDVLNPSSSKYSEKNKRKIDFLLEKGFINQEIYDAVTQVKKNSKKYLEFND
ncbi:MAG: peptidoglycan-binding protein [Candidatus Pacebacteria bacterium]|nr:peptidoglycan-binding protein [Candidatus Paceibacterota bacterium]